ncbi:MAG: ABC transporter substrate-binding protein [Chloroflexi bacterium]|nr:ABC transporter substrate-binding protein [Chloroflexota bacterium]MCI0579691.1 ABC transporter substrate-binding protein [Chloroflexota bacterium]MCI0649578.1 ABC transporter substrate-binding protein [Chloroflexota bacterium]MCI0729346.1 ABC transporter substrate-binding protein [Chloroflexota bacterium]
MKRSWFSLLCLILALLLIVACSSGDQDATPAATEAPPAEEEEAANENTGGAIEAGESETEEEAVEIAEFHQAPMLDDMDLPPVEERLPVDVQVVEPVGGVIGEYGGTWFAVTGDGAGLGNIKMKLYDPPIRWKPDYTGYEPGLAKGFEWSDDGTEFTMHFREGVRWSDGEPFTMEDMRFWWEDLAVNEDYKVIQVPWWGFNSDGTPMEVTFPDDYTMVMKWDTPQWVTPYIIAQGFWEWEPLMKPRHYLEQFHPTYNPDATFEELEAMDKWWQNPDYPSLFAWHVESFEAGARTVFVRNPYYWKVDTEGNQLPYIDRLDVSIIPDPEVRLLELSQGKYTSFRGSDDPNTIPFLAEQAEAGGYHLATGWMNGAGGWPCWLINQNYPGTKEDATEVDQEIGDLLRDKNFRQGISHAMNRQRLIDVAWGGIGTAQQSTISPQSWHFASPEGKAVFEEWQQAYTEYDPDKANELLDAAGMVDADGDGWRDLPSGEPFQLILDLGDWGGQQVSENSTESFAGDLNEVGINVLINPLIGQPDWDLRQKQGLYMLRNCHASEVDLWTYPDWVFPMRNERAWPMEGWWRQTGGEEGWQPEEGSPAARLQALYDQGASEPDVNRRHEIVWEAIRIHIEEGPFVLGAAGDQPMPVVIQNNFCNVPDSGILGPWAPGSPGNMNPSQFWINEGEDSCP